MRKASRAIEPRMFELYAMCEKKTIFGTTKLNTTYSNITCATSRQEKANTLCFFPVLIRVYYYVGYVFSGFGYHQGTYVSYRRPKRRDGDNEVTLHPCVQTLANTYIHPKATSYSRRMTEQNNEAFVLHSQPQDNTHDEIERV